MTMKQAFTRELGAGALLAGCFALMGIAMPGEAVAETTNTTSSVDWKGIDVTTLTNTSSKTVYLYNVGKKQ